MNNTIKELFSGNLFHAEQCGIQNEEIKELTKSLCAIFGKLKVALGEEHDLIDRFEETSVCLNALYQEEFFVAGFKLGLKIATEAFH